METIDERKERVLKILSGKLEKKEYRHSAFTNGQVLESKAKALLPAMGWNSWNAFGSDNTEELTKEIADAMIRLELDKKGYQYVVLDDGCYHSERVDGKLSNNKEKFPSGFRALADYLHERGLKFGMYNDIGTNLCAGAEVGTCGYEKVDAASYLDWDIDFIKVDNCYYLYDNATFSDPCNARYVFAPNLRTIQIKSKKTGENFSLELSAVTDGVLSGRGGKIQEDYVKGLGTADGTGPENSPVGVQSGELLFSVTAPEEGEYCLSVEYATGLVPETGGWLQVATGFGANATLYYDGFLPTTENETAFRWSDDILISLKKGENTIRLMNHRRQENTLVSYALLSESFHELAPDKDILFSICEWGKTEPQDWGYKVGHSWRILNDISFQVGSPEKTGACAWSSDYTTSITSQYNKAVIMDEYAGPERGYNDPDMMVIGLNGLTETMYRTHMTMWCMMNAPLMLGLDLRKVEKGDPIWQIITNEELIGINQDPRGIQAKRVFSTLAKDRPDMEYIRDNERVDILAKPLQNGIAVSFLNVSEQKSVENICISMEDILKRLKLEKAEKERMLKAGRYRIRNLWTGEEWETEEKELACEKLLPCEDYMIKIMALE